MPIEQRLVHDRITIKKYSNRRLYDSTNKRYVTLDNIASLIREGSEIKVIDSQSGEDISKVILIQVILESEKNKEDILPVSFLHMLIKYGNKVAKDFFENYFLMMFQPYNYLKDNYRENIRMWRQMGLYPSDLNMPQDFEKLNSKDIAPSTIKDDSKSDELYDAPVEYRASDVELLMEKMRELEKKVNSLDEEK
ncbi:MAG: polyhydroxyalkanoate synthesis regulator DNA-binding domain-containing protein [Candidatus Dadabacteria bacterium]|nr:polyhydroxyalkanoate synthesis regulator DNA-binding domain-containing protein [Candidatus Dadabacteria bacterium]MCZ6685681.1 polyhydroxyalkanoate synthesis regulator DNA-binding domain-containing protein [Candidatus Dadabacteria bacterium]MCZ6865400.1 polyhydroxyalkanoate synthesis regulator DNA-binding domain-containing protein [Candidatus Dadabacteria bacterium]